MGNQKRPAGRPKKKSIKAAISSTAGSKRKLTRMGKKRKKNQAGTQATFIGRSKCLKKLQITLKDFRRLCILKGIYPRQPIGRVQPKKKHQNLYHIKDIRSISHEPILDKFREFKAFMKKVRRAAGRHEIDEARRKNALLPSYTVHHLVKERYPRFIDALSDMDDALTLCYLFAALPGERPIQSKITIKAKTLVAAWGAYCATTSSITKSFISVKGIYIETVIQAVPIRWIIPHAFTQFMPDDVDYRVMLTFFEFYETLLNFVLFKLYSDIGVRYPFSFRDFGKEVTGSTSTILGANLRALTNALNSTSGTVGNVVSAMLEKDNKSVKANTIANIDTKKVQDKKSKELIKAVGELPVLSEEVDNDDNSEESDDDDSVDVAGPLRAALDSVSENHARSSLTALELDDSGLKRKRLFAGLTFYLSREVPRGYLELVGLAFGAKVGWEGDDSPVDVNDSTITHHIVDRPQLPDSYKALPKSREYVQPQWILDCANFLFLLPIGKYSIGATLPPHLSPWVNDEEEGYKPAYAEEIERLKNGEIVEDEINDADVAMESESENVEEVEATEDKEIEGKKQPAKEYQTSNEEALISDRAESAAQADYDEEQEDENMDDDDDDSEKQRELQEKRHKKEKDEAHILAKTMMNRKAAKLYGRMQHGIALKKSKVDLLHQRRKEIDASNKDKTVLKQKVERLKKERKTIEDSYDKIGVSNKRKKKKSM